MDTEKKEVKAVATAAPAAKTEKKVAAKKTAAKKVAAPKAEKKAAAPKAEKKVAAKAEKKAAPAKKVAAKKTAAKKVDVVVEIDGQQIAVADIAKKLPKAGKIYVVASEKKAYDEAGNGVDLF